MTQNSWNSSVPVEVASGGSGAATLTGVLTGNGTSAFTVSTVTDNTVVMGSTSNLLQDTTITVTDNGEMVNASQPAFLAYLASSDSNATGSGATYLFGDTDVNTAFTEVFDQNSDFVTGSSTGCTFTAPVTGRYFIEMESTFAAATNATQITMNIITSNRTYILLNTFSATAATCADTFYAVADLDASDTVTWSVALNGVGGNTAQALGTANLRNRVAGYLIC